MRLGFYTVNTAADLGRPPVARFPENYTALSGDVVNEADIAFAVSQVIEILQILPRCDQMFALTHEAEVGTMQVSEFGDDNRAGIDRTLHRISCLRNRYSELPKSCRYLPSKCSRSSVESVMLIFAIERAGMATSLGEALQHASADCWLPAPSARDGSM